MADRRLEVSAAPKVYTALRDRILSGSLSSGTRMDSVQVLARQMDVQRDVVAEALDRLAAEYEQVERALRAWRDGS